LTKLILNKSTKLAAYKVEQEAQLSQKNCAMLHIIHKKNNKNVQFSTYSSTLTEDTKILFVL